MDKEIEIDVLIDYYMTEVFPGKTYKSFTFNTDGIVTIKGIEED